MRSLIPFLALATLARCQSTTSTFEMDMSTDPARKPLSAAFMNITFSASSSPICSHEPNASSALSIAIRTLPQTRACFNLASTFSSPDQTYNSQGTGRCDSKLGLCGIKYTVFNSLGEKEIDLRGWDNVFYTQVRNPLNSDGEGDGGGSGGRLELEVFSGDGCESSGDGGSARWNCVEGEGSCSGLGFGARSFRVRLMDAEDVGMGSCAVAVTGGVGGRIGVGIGGFGVVLLGMVIGLWT